MGNQTSLKTALEIDRDTGSVKLVSGASITEFSTDDTLSGDSDSAVPTEQAVKGYVDPATMIGASNAQWIPLAFQGANNNGQTSYRVGGGAILNQGSTDIGIAFSLCIPYTLGSLTLTITDYRVILQDADSDDYVDQTRIFGSNNSGATTEHSETDNFTSAGVHWSDGTTHTAVTDFDASSYHIVVVYLNLVNTTSDQLDIVGVDLKGYYS